MRIPKSISSIASVCEPGSARYALAGVQIGRENKKPFAVATDGRRLIHVTWQEDDLEAFKDEAVGDRQSIIVPGEALREMAGMVVRVKEVKGGATKKKRVYLDESNGAVLARFSHNGTTRELRTEPVEGRFPKWHDVLPKESDLKASAKYKANLLLGTLKAAVAALEAAGETLVEIAIFDSTLMRITGEKDGKKITAVIMGVSE